MFIEINDSINIPTIIIYSKMFISTSYYPHSYSDWTYNRDYDPANEGNNEINLLVYFHTLFI